MGWHETSKAIADAVAGDIEQAESVGKLLELDKIEWFDVARRLRPELTEEQYNAMWDEFQSAKRIRNANG